MKMRDRIIIGILSVALVVSVGVNVTLATRSSASSPPTSSPTAPTSPTDPALGLQRDYVQVVNAVRPSVVEIATTSGLGSGVIYDTSGDIVTNAHVVGNATSFTVTLANGTSYPASLIGRFTPDDLAVIRVRGADSLVPATFSTASRFEVGNLVLAIGSPLGLSSSVTDGIVSFSGRTVSESSGVVLTDMIQTSAAINPGNSGGALVNISGQVIGIPTLVASDGNTATAGLGFAIPSTTVRLIVPQLISQGKVTSAGRASLGISGATAVSGNDEPLGVVVTEVTPGGPAARAGIATGMLITALDKRATPTLETLNVLLSTLKPGQQVPIALTTETGQRRIVEVVLGDLAQD